TLDPEISPRPKNPGGWSPGPPSRRKATAEVFQELERQDRRSDRRGLPEMGQRVQGLLYRTGSGSEQGPRARDLCHPPWRGVVQRDPRRGDLQTGQVQGRCENRIPEEARLFQ